MKKNILLIGIIWTILTVMFLIIISGYDPIESSVSEYQNTIYALIVFQFIPSIFLAAYYLKTKSVQKISYVILGLIYTWSFVILLSMSVNEEGIVFLIILLLIPIIGVIIWIKRKQSRHTVTKNNHIKNKTKTEKNNSYDQLKKEISEYQLKKEMGEYQLKKEIDEYENKNKKTVSEETVSEETVSEETVSEEIKHTKKGIADLLKLPESETLEFKSTLKWDIRQEKSNPALVLECVKTIAGFLNNRGGILIVGYDDDNNIVYGLEKDYPFTSKKQNYDGWQQYFINQINDKLGKTINHYFTIDSISYNGKTLAKINVKMSPSPVFTKQDNNEGNFYVRIHGQTENLNPQETQKWISDHFSN
jgi:hypothetical protein